MSVDGPAASAPEPAERGRYAAYETPDGGLAISRATPLCDRCKDCGCGDQQPAVTIPLAAKAMRGDPISMGEAMGVVGQIQAAMGGTGGGPLRALMKAVMPRGR